MADNKFLVFDVNKSNMQSDADYATETQRTNGVVNGIAKAEMHNKLFRQTSVMVAAIGELVKAAGYDATDTDVATLVNNLSNTLAQKPYVDAQLAAKASRDELNAQKSRIDILTSVTDSSFYEKTTSNIAGALLIVSSGATTNQINLADVIPAATGYTPAIGDYVRLVYGVSSGSAELIDMKIDSSGSVFTTPSNHINNIENAVKTGRSEYRFGKWEQGGLIDGIENNASNVLPIRIRTKGITLLDTIILDVNNKIAFTIADGYSVGVEFFSDANCTTLLYDSTWLTGTSLVYKYSNYIRLYAKNNSGANINATIGTDIIFTYYRYNIYGDAIMDKTIVPRHTSFQQIDLSGISITENKYVNKTNGTLVTNTDRLYYAFDYIDVETGVKYILRTCATNDLAGLAFYNDEDLYISGLTIGSSLDGLSETEFIVPKNSTKIRFTCVGTDKLPGVYLAIVNNEDHVKKSISNAEKSRYDYLLMFHKNGGIGDSLMSGEHAYHDANGDHYIDRYNFSWLSNICRTTGASCVHYSAGGLTAKAWLDSIYKTNLINETEKCSAYFIALGTNDYNTMPYPLGTINDTAGTNTFVGYYKQIIEVVKTNAPNAVIFTCSMYSSGTTQDQYSNMVSSIADLYDMCFYIDFINNTDTPDISVSQYVNWGHFNTLGYIRVANDIKRLANNIVESNISDFAMFGLSNN